MSKPSGILKSTFLPPDILGGTKIFLKYDGKKYSVETRFQILKQSNCIKKAESFYEKFLLGWKNDFL